MLFASSITIITRSRWRSRNNSHFVHLSAPIPTKAWGSSGTSLFAGSDQDLAIVKTGITFTNPRCLHGIRRWSSHRFFCCLRSALAYSYSSVIIVASAIIAARIVTSYWDHALRIEVWIRLTFVVIVVATSVMSASMLVLKSGLLASRSSYVLVYSSYHLVSCLALDLTKIEVVSTVGIIPPHPKNTSCVVR